MQNLTTFLQTTPLATLTAAQQSQYNQLESTLATLVSQLPSLNPSAYGIVANTDQEDLLFSTILPQYYQALMQSTIQYLTSGGFTASLKPQDRKRMLAEAERLSQQAVLQPASWHPGDVMFLKTGLHSLRHGRGPGHELPV